MQFLKKDLRREVCFLMTLVCLAAFLPAQTEKKEKPQTLTPGMDARVAISSAVAIAVSENRSILLVFGSANCPACAEFMKTLEGAPAIKQVLSTDFVLVKIGMEGPNGQPTNLDIANLYKVTDFGWPCLAVLDRNAGLLCAQSTRAFVGEGGFSADKILLFLKLYSKESGLQPLRVGDKALPSGALKWLKGGPVDFASSNKGQTTVILFWSVSSENDRAAMTYLNELYGKLKGKNLAMVAVSNEEDAKVQEFLKKTPVDFAVAVDQGRVFRKKYLGSTDFSPYIFIINKDGMISWAGFPWGRLERDLGDIVSGTFDIGKNELITQKEREFDALRRLNAPLAKSMDKINELLQLDPNYFPYFMGKIDILKQLNEPDPLQKLFDQLLVKFDGSAKELNDLAWAQIGLPYELIDLEMAWKAAKRAVQLTKGENSQMLETLARVFYELGLIDFASSIQAIAVKKLPADSPSMIQSQRLLNYYTKLKGSREKVNSYLSTQKEEDTVIR